jgi:deoxyribodipyrimidine photo-lyase
MADVPETRLRTVRDLAIRGDGRFVLYWMTANRRVGWNFALERAVRWCRELKRPLVVLETLEGERRWATARHHQFVLDGMRIQAERLRPTPALYYPYVADKSSQVTSLLTALGRDACVVICDDAPIHEQDTSPEEACGRMAVRVEAVDSVGLLPMCLAERAYPSAYAMRRFVQKRLGGCLLEMPVANPLGRAKLPAAEPLPAAIMGRWRPVTGLGNGGEPRLGRSAIDASVGPVSTVGGSEVAECALGRFVRSRLDQYAELRNHPDDDATSGLSPYLRFGHLSAQQVFVAVARHEGWSPDRLSEKADGRREGWWGMGESAEAFLDQVVTWRELGINFCVNRPDYAEYDSLPPWAMATLQKHARDRREYEYSLEELERSTTHDPTWNAAQRQLVHEGRLHNYLRMLWGKKILEWSRSPREALAAMIELNNKYALDRCDPNSYSGIFWVLGRYDRPFGPERTVFGKIRYMSSPNTARKVRLRQYVVRYGATEAVR